MGYLQQQNGIKYDYIFGCKSFLCKTHVIKIQNYQTELKIGKNKSSHRRENSHKKQVNNFSRVRFVPWVRSFLHRQCLL